MSAITQMAEQISQLKLSELLDSPIVRNQFIQVYNTLWGEGEGEAAYERESFFFKALLREKEDLRKCTTISVYLAFIDLAVSGLSLEPGTRALAYMLARSCKTGYKTPDGKDAYEKRCNLTISAYGELVMRVRAGQIRHADNPVVVYDNDSFSFSDIDGRKSVSYTCNYPHAGHQIVACYLRITRSDGSIDYSVMLKEDWERLAGYSLKNNQYYDYQSRQWKGKANALYGEGERQIDPGFLAAKCIKHAFKSYPKVRIGKATTLETSTIDQPEKDFDFYGGVDAETGEVSQPAAAPDQPEQADFAEPQPLSQGVTIDEQPDDGAF